MCVGVLCPEAALAPTPPPLVSQTQKDSYSSQGDELVPTMADFSCLHPFPHLGGFPSSHTAPEERPVLSVCKHLLLHAPACQSTRTYTRDSHLPVCSSWDMAAV